MFAARAGARKVYGVEASGIVEFARLIIEENGLSDKITIIHGIMEEVEIPEKVDLIVSEWMGYALLYESMLPSVMFARDKYMKPGGRMFPDLAHLYIAAVDHPTIQRSKIDYWNNVHGFNFAPIKKWAEQEALVEDVKDSCIVTEACTLAEIDLNTVTVQDLAVWRPFELVLFESKPANGFVLWFDVVFTGGEMEVELTTSPFEPATHWSQTLFFMGSPMQSLRTERIIGEYQIKPNERNPRDQDITIKYGSQWTAYLTSFKLR
jgi:protein arginine N-methyltransferase 1